MLLLAVVVVAVVAVVVGAVGVAVDDGVDVGAVVGSLDLCRQLYYGQKPHLLHSCLTLYFIIIH